MANHTYQSAPCRSCSNRDVSAQFFTANTAWKAPARVQGNHSAFRYNDRDDGTPMYEMPMGRVPLISLATMLRDGGVAVLYRMEPAHQ